MTYVVDASVAVKWFVREHLHAEAIRLLNYQDELRAPDWITLEVAHAAFKKWGNREIGSEQAMVMVQTLPHFFTQLYPASGFTDRAFTIAMTVDHPIYDCLYIACAELTDSVVITADDHLCKAIEDTEFAPLIQHLDSLPG